MALRLVMEPGWEEQVKTAAGQLLDQLGHEVEVDAKRYAPKDTGALARSIEHHMEGHTVVISARGGAGGREYAVYVELGHRVYHPSTGRTGPEVVPPQPFLRPALYQFRG